jgi:hypothetical protein
MDVPLLLAEGRRPRVIVVDDRIATVDEIRTIGGYQFSPGWLWTHTHRAAAYMFRRPTRHSVFVVAAQPATPSEENAKGTAQRAPHATGRVAS